MTSISDFRLTIWLELAALFRHGASYFENKHNQAMPLNSPEEQDEAEAGDSVELIRIQGAPPHWLAMVGERAPDFLHRLETASYQGPPVYNEKRKPARIVSNEHQKSSTQMASKYSTPDNGQPHPKRQSEQSETQPVKRPGVVAHHDFPDGIEYKAAKNRIRFRAFDKSQSGQLTDNIHQTVSSAPSDETTDIRTAKNWSGLGFKPEHLDAGIKTFKQVSAGEFSSIRKTDPANVSMELNPHKEPVLPEKPIAVEQVKEKESLKIDRNRLEFEHNIFQSSVLARFSFSDTGANQAYKKSVAQSAAIQNRPEKDKQSVHRRYQPTSFESVSADNFWPDLSGLEKEPLTRDRWPELPEDVWNDLINMTDKAGESTTSRLVPTAGENSCWIE